MQEYLTVNQALGLGFLIYFTQNLWCCWIGFRRLKKNTTSRTATFILVCLISGIPWLVSYLMGRDQE